MFGHVTLFTNKGGHDEVSGIHLHMIMLLFPANYGLREASGNPRSKMRAWD